MMSSKINGNYLEKSHVMASVMLASLGKTLVTNNGRKQHTHAVWTLKYHPGR
jgi:hypothetical protein